jgi:hypothetical protein
MKSFEDPVVVLCHKEAQKFTKTSITGFWGVFFGAFLWPNQNIFSACPQGDSLLKPA